MTRRTEVLHTRVPHMAKKRWALAAALADRSLSAWVREALDHAAREQIRREPEREEAAR